MVISKYYITRKLNSIESEIVEISFDEELQPTERIIGLFNNQDCHNFEDPDLKSVEEMIDNIRNTDL